MGKATPGNVRGLATVAVLLMLAGCAGNSADPKTSSSSAPPAVVTDEFGSIAGRVFDDEVLPIAGAEVAIAKPAQSTKTDAAGEYTFNQLAPGAYTLVVQALGFESMSRSVNVAAGAVTFANLTLKSVPVSVARTHNLQSEGYLSLWASVPTLTVRPNATGEDFRDIYYKVAPDVDSAVTGMKWQANPGTNSKWMWLEMWVAEKSCATGTLCKVLNRTVGTSPQIVRGDGFQEEATGKKSLQVNPAFGTISCYSSGASVCTAQPDTIVNVAFQQRFSLYTTVFFVEPAPIGFDPLPK